MRRSTLLLTAAAVLLSGCSGTAMGFDQAPAAVAHRASPAGGAVAGPDSEAERLLAAHNVVRSAAGVPPLRWDAQLAAGAQAHAAQIARTGDLVHSARQSRPGQGENLWMGTGGRYTAEQMVQNWANERRLFRPGTFPNVSTTGDWADVAHYTQVIWRSTVSVGCAIQRSGHWDALVCRYSPAGNRDGQTVP